MKSIILTAVLSAMIAMSLTAQNQWPILIGKEGTKTTYLQNGNYHTFALKGNNGEVFFAAGIITTGVGVVYSGLALIAHLDNNTDKTSKYLTNAKITLLSGLGLMTIGITFGVISHSHQKKSVNNYNTPKPGRTENVIISIGFTGEGAGVRLRF
jgi:hypothetical protein